MYTHVEMLTIALICVSKCNLLYLGTVVSNIGAIPYFLTQG